MDTKRSSYWFVGAYLRGQDMTERFVSRGIWETSENKAKTLDRIKHIRVGDRIALKATYTRQNGLPFDNHGKSVSVMAIKAVGTVSENPGTGRKLSVAWEPVPEEPREWYFYTYLGLVWNVAADNWKNRALIAFAFDHAEQDCRRFLNEPFWWARYADPDGDMLPDFVTKPNLSWIPFYEAVASRLRTFRGRRMELLDWIRSMQDRFDLSYTDGHLEDICPFTLFGLFNRGVKEHTRFEIAKAFADFLQVTAPLPESFDAIPILNNQRTSYVWSDSGDRPGDTEALWNIFEAALDFADAPDEASRAAFVRAFDTALNRRGVNKNLTMGLFWIRPKVYFPLDGNSQEFLLKRWDIKIKGAFDKEVCDGKDYLALRQRLADAGINFPEFSYVAWAMKQMKRAPSAAGQETPKLDGVAPVSPTPLRIEGKSPEPYTKKEFLREVYISEAAYDELTQLVNYKYNVILQGAPGVGKTFAAKRLAYAMMGEKDERRVAMVQFHQSYAYEDFIQGYKPARDGFELRNGVFYDFCKAAERDSGRLYFFIIDEINRGNLSKILGELMMLIEKDKRGQSLKLLYADETFSVPSNIRILGMMNTADRSLAMMDYALRRRFAFFEFTPAFDSDGFQAYLNAKASPKLKRLVTAIRQLNEAIAKDEDLGEGFRIGHSYFCIETAITDSQLRAVVEYEVLPLLKEYWFDEPSKTRDWAARLRAAIAPSEE